MPRAFLTDALGGEVLKRAESLRTNKEPANTPKNYSTPLVDRISGIWGSYSSIPKAKFYLLKGGYSPKNEQLEVAASAAATTTAAATAIPTATANPQSKNPIAYKYKV